MAQLMKAGKDGGAFIQISIDGDDGDTVKLGVMGVQTAQRGVLDEDIFVETDLERIKGSKFFVNTFSNVANGIMIDHSNSPA